jgi:hypothetical protein
MRRSLSCLLYVWGLAVLVCAAVCARADELLIVVDQALPPMAQNALGELQRAFGVQGSTTRMVGKATGGRPMMLVGIAGNSPEVDRVLTAENWCWRRGPNRR